MHSGRECVSLATILPRLVRGGARNFCPALAALVGPVKILPSKHTISNHFFTVSSKLGRQLGPISQCVSLAQIDRLDTVNIEYQNNYMNDIGLLKGVWHKIFEFGFFS
jgi:hypothetical protein